MRKIFLALMFFIGTNILACPFDEASVDVTIMAHKKISKAIQNKDFQKAQQEIKAQQELYSYFEKTSNTKIYQPLLDYTKVKDTQGVKKLLDYTLYLEIVELLTDVEKNFDNYQKARLALIKTKKHLKALTKDKQALKYLRTIFKSIGNPGLMGVGKKEANKTLFRENKKILLKSLVNYGCK